MGIVRKIEKKLMVGLQAVAPVIATKLLFKHFLGYPLNLKNPQTLNEKMQWLKLNTYKDNPLITKCVDKYEVREYVEDKGCSDLLVKLIGVWDKADEIDWEKLPNCFVLKCNHGSGSVILCRDKSKLDKKATEKQLTEWLNEDFGLQRAELAYKHVQKRIICEELIETDNGLAPKDYKFFCSYGEPKFLFVASDRNGDDAKFDYFDLKWNHYPVKNGHPNSEAELPMPTNFEEMIEASKKLSADFPLVRVDLYNENGRVLFGELTFLHFGGLHSFEPMQYDRLFGSMFDISGLVNNK